MASKKMFEVRQYHYLFVFYEFQFLIRVSVSGSKLEKISFVVLCSSLKGKTKLLSSRLELDKTVNFFL